MPKGIAARAIAIRMSGNECEHEGIALGKEKPIKLLEPDAEMTIVADALIEHDAEETIERCNEKGVSVAVEIVADYNALYKKYEPMVMSIQNDEQKLTEPLWDGVFPRST